MENKDIILCPCMVEPHFTLLENVLHRYGFNVKALRNKDETVLKTGLKYVHNDMCYPAILVIGQLISALESGEYDLEHTSLAITQTGGGCRASNYIYLLRKALEKAHLDKIKVYSVNSKKIDENTIVFPIEFLVEAVYGVFYADLMKNLYNQARSHELNKGDSKKALDEAVNYLLESKMYLHFKKKIKKIINIFNSVERDHEDKVKVGIVGEIYLKYSPLGNNDLEDYLISQNVEPLVSGVLDFGMYGFENNLIDHKLYHRKTLPGFLVKGIIQYTVHKQNVINKYIKKYSDFTSDHNFNELKNSCEGIIDMGAKMGEGWLLSAEIGSYMKHGVKNIISCQPFGCLPNHIVAKGIQSNVRKMYPDANIVAIDYDASISKVNQENRINLMIMNAKKIKNESSNL